jgi:hypothetical protein
MGRGVPTVVSVNIVLSYVISVKPGSSRANGLVYGLADSSEGDHGTYSGVEGFRA